MKLKIIRTNKKMEVQPPSGGCVLKLALDSIERNDVIPAAFRRLCVETISGELLSSTIIQPPSGGCVLKL